MKIAVFALFILCTTAAFGQIGASALSSQPQMVESPSYPLHAVMDETATESPLVGGGG